MTDDPIRERVARAIYDAQPYLYSALGGSKTFDEIDHGTLVDCLHKADAALRECGYEEMRRERDELKAALAWVNTCVPRPLKWGGGSVEMTDEEFNRMRVAIGLAPLPYRKRARAALSRTQGEG